MRHAAYGLDFDTDFPLGSLLPRSTRPSNHPADVHIRIAPLPDATGDTWRQLGPFLWARENELRLVVPRIARFGVRDGNEIVVDPDPTADEDSIRVFLLGSPLGALLHQRGLLVLHGNAVRIGDRCMVCVGPSGAGKSTLAAAFLQRGHAVLADDIVPVDGDGRALPGYPRIKLWRDAADKLAIATEGLRAVRPQIEKYHVPTIAQFAGEPLPVRWIYILDRHPRAEVRIDAVAGLRRFEPLRDNTYRARFLAGLVLEPQHLRLCGALAGRVHMARVTRPEQGFELDVLVDRLLADVAAHP